MIWVLGCAILFFTLFSGGLLLKNTANPKGIFWLLGILGVFAIGVYLFYGTPFLPDHPYHKIQQISTPKETLKAFDQIVIQQEIVRQNPKEETAWFDLGNLYQETKQFYKAALVYREAWKLKPTSYEYKFAYTQALLFFNNMTPSKATTQLLKELHQKNPKDEKVARFMGLGLN